MRNLYSPENEVELAFIKSIFEGEDIHYFVRNNHFGSLEIGPKIELYNAKMIMVPEGQYERAKDILADFFSNINEDSPDPKSKYSLTDKMRMIIETILFSWFVPGKKRWK